MEVTAVNTVTGKTLSILPENIRIIGPNEAAISNK